MSNFTSRRHVLGLNKRQSVRHRRHPLIFRNTNLFESNIGSQLGHGNRTQSRNSIKRITNTGIRRQKHLIRFTPCPVPNRIFCRTGTMTNRTIFRHPDSIRRNVTKSSLTGSNVRNHFNDFRRTLNLYEGVARHGNSTKIAIGAIMRNSNVCL